MSNVYADTVLLNARSFIEENRQKRFELRRTKNKVVEAFLRDREFTVPNLSEIKESVNQTTEFMYFKSKDFTIHTGKSNSPSGEKSGTGKATLSWNERGFVVDLPTKQYHNNEVSKIQGYAMSLWNAEKTFWDDLATQLVAYLAANQSTVNDGDDSGDGTFNSGVMTLSNADVDQFYNILQGHMDMNSLDAPFMDIASTYWTKYMRHIAAQGAGNDENLQYQFGNFEVYPANAITPDAANSSEHYIVPAGGITLLDWNDPDNRQGTTLYNGELTTYQSLFFPEITFDLFVQEDLQDSSDDGGYVQDKVLTLEFTLNYATAKQPFTESGRTPIYKYEITKV